MGKKPVKYCVVDAFTDSAFKGNPAAVCLLEDERDDEWLQSVAAEFNISETCYLTPIAESESENDSSPHPRFRLRWFTPLVEVVLPSGKTVADFQAQFDEIQRWFGRGVIVTGIAPSGSGFDFFSCFFCPKLGINEKTMLGLERVMWNEL